ncbi:MAG: two-component system response regulator TtrR [Limisphaerales bacterium]|jgi:two-component system response regulator TtrR
MAVIVVVDDDVSILDAISLVLEDQGWEIKTYTHGQAFLDDWLHGGAIDCLVLDPHLDGLSGAAVVEALIGNPIPIPIIGLTARPESAVTQRIRELGVEIVLLKPVLPDVFVEAIKAVLAGTR